MNEKIDLGELQKARFRARPVFEIKAVAGDPFAMRQLASLYENGWAGVLKDLKLARSWFERAADLRELSAVGRLGFFYQYGLGGCLENIAHALSCFRVAAESGDSFAMTQLGLAYLSGLCGLKKSGVEAARWFNASIKKIGSTETSFLNWMKSNGLADVSRVLYGTVRIAEGLAPNNLGYMYQHGLGNLGKNYERAAHWFKCSADLGNPYGLANLGQMYQYGFGGLRKNEAEAFRLFEEALAAEDPCLDAKEYLKKLNRKMTGDRWTAKMAAITAEQLVGENPFTSKVVSVAVEKVVSSVLKS